MQAVGIAASVVGAVVVVLFLVIVIASLPDLARYRRLRRM